MSRPAIIAPLVAQAPEPLRDYIAQLERAAGDDFRVNRIGKSHTADPDTSLNAAVLNFPRSGSQRERVLRKLVEFDSTGATFEQLQTATGIESAAKRLTELVQGGWAIQTQATRKTHTGAKATVHIASATALQHLEADRSADTTAGGGTAAGAPPADTGDGTVRAPDAPPSADPVVLFDPDPETPAAFDPYRDSRAA